MKSSYYKVLFLFIFILFSQKNNAQELPSIIKYTSENYLGGNQNWMIDQDQNQTIYIANNEGLLEFNGSQWKLNISPNETIIRSVKVIDNLIYTGCYMEFGFWKKNTFGELKYYSLSQKIKNKLIDDEQFWNIINYDHWVIFQSLNRIYIYDTQQKNFKIIEPKSGILKSFKNNNNIYFQTNNEGLFEIENGKERLITNDASILDKKIINIFDNEDRKILQTQQNGSYVIENKTVRKSNQNIDQVIQSTSIYTCIKLSNGFLALGTISNGLYIFDNNLQLLHHITQDKGLSNNTVLSLFEDENKNLWIGLDNGVDCININSPIKSFFDKTGILGTVYTSILHNNKLYIGTNQGLFVKNNSTNQNFQLIAGTKGQVWNLFQYDSQLFCGHDSGTFLINDQSAQLIFNQSGTWKFEANPTNPNQIIQGNYSGLSVLTKSNNQWKFSHKIKGFDYSTKFFEIAKNKEIYISHEYKSIFRLTINKDLTSVTKTAIIDNPSIGKNVALAKFNGQILFCNKEGIFKLNETKKIFEKDSLLSKVFENDEYRSGKMIVDTHNKLWLFTKNNINYFTPGKINNAPKINSIPIPYSLNNSMLGYENISFIDKKNYLIGTTDGYYSIDITDLKIPNYRVFLNNIVKSKNKGEKENLDLFKENDINYSFNNLYFNVSVPKFEKYLVTEYQYQIEGFQDYWSEWQTENTINLKNLPAGNYVFKLRAKTGNQLSENEIIFPFKINKPWYASTLAYIIYICIIIVAAIFIHKTYKTYYSNQKLKLIEENKRKLELKELEVEQELLRLKNIQLEQDVNNKNRELAASTMNLIKKNELLTAIKDDLKKSDDESKNIKTVITTINKNISEEDTWDLFKEAFNNADKDFLKKTKILHPSLTPNDLRLCAYLRLNLSSKEIAPLLNISIRSVEIKRYRLRKKMDLPHEQGLVEYILAI